MTDAGARNEAHKRIDDAFKQGDLAALKTALKDPPDFPGGSVSWVREVGIGAHILEYAIYHSPFSFIGELLDAGANPNYADSAGFPSLIAALTSDREDRYAIVELLLDRGADIQQRGVNDYTPLHHAVVANDRRGMELLISRGADPDARTNIDEHATPLEEAEILGNSEAAEAYRKLLAR